MSCHAWVPSTEVRAWREDAREPRSRARNVGLLPDNVTAIVNFLLSNGYTANAAAGIAGNIYQESKGDPESVGMGGGGLIGWTPLPSGFVTGAPTADLQTQLAAILTYNNGWSAYLPALNDGGHARRRRLHLRHRLRARGYPRREHPRSLRGCRRRCLRPVTFRPRR